LRGVRVDSSALRPVITRNLTSYTPHIDVAISDSTSEHAGTGDDAR
jgi:hypothetical protein